MVLIGTDYRIQSYTNKFTSFWNPALLFISFLLHAVFSHSVTHEYFQKVNVEMKSFIIITEGYIKTPSLPQEGKIDEWVDGWLI